MSTAVVSGHGAAKTPKNQWVAIETRHFTVLAQGSPEKARRWVQELEQFQMGMQRILPVPEDRLRPVTVLLFANDRALRPFKPLEKGKPQEIAGFFARIQDSQAIGLALDYEPDDVRRLIYHEAVHWHTSAADQPLPPWLMEGLAEVYSTFKRTPEGKYMFGQAINEHVARMRQPGVFTLEKLTGIPSGSLEFSENRRATLFYAQSWAFVHYLLFGKDTPGMESIVRYLNATEKSASLDDAFTLAFGAPAAEFDRRLATYMRGGTYLTYAYALPDKTPADQLKPRPARESEVALAQGILLLGARGEGTPEVLGYLYRAAALDPAEPRVWQALGEAALLGNNYTEAEEHFRKAAATGSQSYFVHYGLGVTRVRAQQALGNFSNNAELVEAAKNFRRAITLNPRFVPAYASLAGVMPALEQPEKADRARLEQGRVLAPDNAIIDIGLSAYDFRTGQSAIARQRLEVLLVGGDKIDPEARNLAVAMLQDEDWRRFSGRLDKMFRERRYAEVVAAIDAGRADFSEPRYREALVLNRQMADNYRQIAEAVNLANEGKRDAAVELLKKLEAGTTHPPTKAEARRLLGELGKARR